MSVTSEDIHIAGRIYDGGVSISWCWSATLDEAGLLWSCFGSQGLLTLKFWNKLAINFETFVGVFNNESVFHANTGRAAQFALAVTIILIHIILLHGTGWGSHLLSWGTA